MSMAGPESLRFSNTPTTTQAVRCFSGAPLFMLNSSSISLFSMSVLKKMQFADVMMIGIADAAIIGAGAVECQNATRISCAKRPVPPCFTAAR
jgi:hypothetical protein